MYYNDLSVYKYGRKNLGDNHLNIGWLNDDDYPKGEVPDGFLNKLKNSVCQQDRAQIFADSPLIIFQ